MKKFTSKIQLVLVLIALFAILDIFDDYLLIVVGIKDNHVEEIIFDTSVSLSYIVLVLWALVSGKKVITKFSKDKEYYQNLIDLSPEAIYVHNQGKTLFTNKAGLALLAARDIEDLLEYNLEENIQFKNEDAKKAFKNELETVTDQSLNYQLKVKRIDGKKIDVELTSTIIELDGLALRLVVARDVTTKRKQEKMIKQLAYIDELTGLPNRRAYLAQLEKALLNSEKANTTFAIMFIDLDGFKKVNDTLGHEAGDEVLKRFSTQVKSFVREKDTVARLAGDEFTILLPNTNQQESLAIAQRIIKKLDLSFPNENIQVTASIGITLYPHDGQDVYTLIKNADIAMYQAKQKGKNQFQFFE